MVLAYYNALALATAHKQDHLDLDRSSPGSKDGQASY